MTTQEKITLYKTALEYIAEGKETVTGLCWLLQVIVRKTNKTIS